jgi:hypothetical protein
MFALLKKSPAKMKAGSENSVMNVGKGLPFLFTNCVIYGAKKQSALFLK